MSWVSLVLLTAALVGVVALLVQRFAVWRFLSTPRALSKRRPPMSVLKPLCGVDDALEENLRSFAALEYPQYEVLLGVKDERDAAYSVAMRVAAQYPQRFRVVVQQGEPGLNPKVNQLVTLARAAKHDVLVISDSNAQLASGALLEMAALFDDERVGCVTSPVSGRGHESLGALLDNLHLASAIGSGQIGAKYLADKDLVVGKSMALRRAALEVLGGFAAFSNVLAEDYVMGQALRAHGFRVALTRSPVHNIAVNRSVASFFKRYLRWSVIHRTAISLPTYLSQALLNPWPLALLATLLEPTSMHLFATLGIFTLKLLIDASSARALGVPLDSRVVAAVAVKDALLFIAWCNGLFARTVDWRGNRLRVGPGSRLVTSPGDLVAVTAGVR